MFNQLDIKHKVFEIALSAGPLKWLNTLEQIVSNSSFDHFGVHFGFIFRGQYRILSNIYDRGFCENSS